MKRILVFLMFLIGCGRCTELPKEDIDASMRKGDYLCSGEMSQNVVNVYAQKYPSKDWMLACSIYEKRILLPNQDGSCSFYAYPVYIRDLRCKKDGDLTWCCWFSKRTDGPYIQ